MRGDIQFTWKPEKAERVWRERRIRFEEAETALDDPCALLEFDQEHSSINQERWKVVGFTNKQRMLTVIHCEADPIHGLRQIHIITCWKATPQERKRDEQENGLA